MYRVLIADSSVKERDSIVEKLNEEFELAFCTDGRDLYNVMHVFDPEILFLDLQLPNVNSLDLLRDLRAMGNTVTVVVTTTYLYDYIFSILLKLNVVAVLQKPWKLKRMVDEIRQVAQAKKLGGQQCVESELNYILGRLGFQPETKRYLCAWHGIMKRYKEPDCGLTKEVYPEIAHLLEVGDLYVEKALRDGIRYAVAMGEWDLWKAFFPTLKPGKHPTNEEFINRIVHAIRNGERPRKDGSFLIADISGF